MGRRVGVSSVENQIRSKRQASGLSQQELARRCGLTRQAMNAIEADHYIPNTVVALRIARALGCRVEELFRLSEERPRVEAEWLGDAPVNDAEPTRICLARVGNRLLAHPLTGSAAFTAADGLAVPVKRPQHPYDASHPSVSVDLLIDAQLPEHTVVVLGCDPALALLGAHLARRYHGFRLVWVHRSSLAALRMLGHGEAHAAGTHLWDPASGEYNVPYVRRELAGRRLVVVTLSQWQQGLIVAHGNPKSISSPAELARRDVTIVNREPGSGSRTWLDVWLRHAGTPPQQVRGYTRELRSHMEVAEAVASGVADTGPGILAVARLLGLDFVPLQEERYDLVIPQEFLNTAPLQALLEVSVSSHFQEELAALGGYDGSRAGTVVAELMPA
jgi:putative molybdopterin biosynthesis protein